DFHVTGVQTCALPISLKPLQLPKLCPHLTVKSKLHTPSAVYELSPCSFKLAARARLCAAALRRPGSDLVAHAGCDGHHRVRLRELGRATCGATLSLAT